MNEAVETAIKMETDAVAFYKDAAEKTEHPFGRKMFSSFILDETRHLKMLEAILKGLDITIGDVSPKESIKTVFSELRGEMLERIHATTNELDAIRLAMDMEDRGFKFYKMQSEKLTDPKEKALFIRLTKEEEEHFNILQNTYSFINNIGDWFLWEERGILEG